MAKILVVEDDLRLAQNITDLLKFRHHLVECLHNGREAIEQIAVTSHDLLILDWELPGATGVEICKRFRERGGSSPVLMLTGKAEIDDKATGFDAGADDYLTKPFHVKELCARVDALLRRPRTLVAPLLHHGNITIDPKNRTVRRGDDEIHIEPKEFAVLELLMKHPDEVFSPETILTRVWPSTAESSIDAVRTCIKKLRQKVSPNDAEAVIRTIHRVGYTMAKSPEQGG